MQRAMYSAAYWADEEDESDSEGLQPTEMLQPAPPPGPPPAQRVAPVEDPHAVQLGQPICICFSS